MDIQEIWEKALKETEIIRPRIVPLSSSEATALPYIFLAESSVNTGDTVVRTGKVMVEKPSIILPQDMPHFEGFDFEEDLHFGENTIINFLIVRGVRFPSLKYNNQVSKIDIFEGPLSKAIKEYSHRLQKTEDVHTGLVIGPEDAWQFSVLIFIGAMVSRSAFGDIKMFLDDLKKKMEGKE